MPLTPAEIHNVEFGKAPIGKRGYDVDEVDTLLDEVTHEMIRLLEENDSLQRRLGAPAAAGAPAAPDAAEAELSALFAHLDRARQACDRAELDSHLLGRQLEEARRSAVRPAAAPALDGESADRVLTMAQRTADDHMRDAHEQSRAMLADARERSERMAREGQQLVSDIEQATDRLQNEAAADLAARRAGLLREIDELTEFAANYRAALDSHIVRQGQLLDGTMASDPVS